MEPLPSSSSGTKNFKGVRMRSWGKWVCEIREPNKRSRIWLGSYSTPEAAARAYDYALVCLRGPNVLLNFPESPPDVPASDRPPSPKSIQSLAAAYAAQFVSPLGNATSSASSPRAAAEEEAEAVQEDPLQADDRNQQRESILESVSMGHDQEFQCDIEVCRDISPASHEDWPSFDDYAAPGSSNSDGLWSFDD